MNIFFIVVWLKNAPKFIELYLSFYLDVATMWLHFLLLFITTKIKLLCSNLFAT